MLATPERMKGVPIHLDILSRTYFYLDEPVDYKLTEKTIQIYPVTVKQSEFFLSSVGLLSVDKNAMPSVEIIQMSYLQFILDILLLQDKDNLQRFVNVLSLCLQMKDPRVKRSETGKPILIEGEGEYSINGQQFEDIRRIILYQNLIHFDDGYINPDLKQVMNEMNELKNKKLDNPTLERKMAIVTAHTGLSKKEQMDMTYRSHSLLFEEVCGEVEFTTIRPIALFGGSGDKIDHWIFRKKKDKMENYITNVDKYAQSMGGDKNAIKSANGQLGNQYLQQFNNFNK